MHTEVSESDKVFVTPFVVLLLMLGVDVDVVVGGAVIGIEFACAITQPDFNIDFEQFSLRRRLEIRKRTSQSSASMSNCFRVYNCF